MQLAQLSCGRQHDTQSNMPHLLLKQAKIRSIHFRILYMYVTVVWVYVVEVPRGHSQDAAQGVRAFCTWSDATISISRCHRQNFLPAAVTSSPELWMP